MASAVESRPPAASTPAPANPVFTTSAAPASPITRSGLPSRTDGSSSIPIELKNTPVKSARKGSTSDRACTPYWDSDRMRPARNAPIASEKPAVWVTRAAPRPKKPTQSVNSSRSLSSTIRSSTHGTRRRPPKIRTATMTRPRTSSVSAAVACAP